MDAIRQIEKAREYASGGYALPTIPTESIR
jgi:hypothetical protein